MISLGRHAERWGFPCDPVLFSLAVNFYRLKVNIFSVRRPQDKVTAVLFNLPHVLICMEPAAGSYRCVSGSAVTLTVKAQLVEVNF